MTTLFKPIITLQLELQSNKLHIYVCIYTFLIVIHIIKLKKWQKPGQEEWTISKSFVSQPPQIWGCSGVCEPPGHVAWQNGKRATPKERAEPAAKVLKTIPTHCTSVEMVQEKHDAEQVLSSPHRSLHSSPVWRPETKPWWFKEQLHRTAVTKGKRREEYTLGKKAVKCLVSSSGRVTY